MSLPRSLVISSNDLFFHMQQFNLNPISGPLANKPERRTRQLPPFPSTVHKKSIATISGIIGMPRCALNQIVVEIYECSLWLPFRPATHLNT